MTGAGHGWRVVENSSKILNYKNPETEDLLIATKSNGTWELTLHRRGGGERWIGDFKTKRAARERITEYARRHPASDSSSSRSSGASFGVDTGFGMRGSPGMEGQPFGPFRF